MVLDTSAILAILFDEPERRSFNESIEAAESRLVSAATYLETAIIIDDRLGEEGGRDLKRLIDEANIEIVPVTAEQAEIARRAYALYGRGNHPAGLNFGDCFSYALARLANQPLLFKGDDFSRTDIVPARP